MPVRRPFDQRFSVLTWSYTAARRPSSPIRAVVATDDKSSDAFAWLDTLFSTVADGRPALCIRPMWIFIAKSFFIDLPQTLQFGIASLSIARSHPPFTAKA